MPKVGNKHFPYTKKGEKMAEMARKMKKKKGMMKQHYPHIDLQLNQIVCDIMPANETKLLKMNYQKETRH